LTLTNSVSALVTSNETDRGCGVLGSALLDARLELLFRRRLRKFHKELLDGMGSLGTFSARIRMACALGWIDEDAADDLNIIRFIRNDFAHSHDHNLSFQNESIESRCKNLRSAQAFIEGFDIATETLGRNLSIETIKGIQKVYTTARWRYQLAVEFITQYLDSLPEENSQYSGPDFLLECRDSKLAPPAYSA